MATTTLIVEVDNLEEDYDPELVRKRVQEALNEAFLYHDVTVDVYDD